MPAPPIQFLPYITPSALAANQQAQKDKITPDAAKLNDQVKALPAYPAYLQAMQSGNPTQKQAALNTLSQQIVSTVKDVPDSVIYDPFTQQFREKNWNERNSNWSALMYTGAAIGTGLTLGYGGAALLGGGGAADVGATTTVPEAFAGSGAVAGGGAAAGGTGAAVAGGTAAGDVGATTAATVPAASTAGPLAGGYGAATTEATVPASLAGTGTTTATTGGILSKTLSSLTQPSVLGTIASGAFGAYGASQAAGAQTDAAKIIADANTAAAKIQADASVQAAQIQAKSTADALDFSKQGYNNQLSAYNTNQQQLSPYTGAGTAAVTKLSQLLGLGTPSAPYTPLQPVPTAATAPPPQTGVQSMARPGTAAQQASADAFVPNAVKNNPALAAVPQTPGPNAGNMPLSSLASQPPSAAQPQMVAMRAPDGSVRQVPADHVQQLTQLGAQPVGA